MKNTLVAIALLVSANAFAGVADVEPVNESILPSTVEKVVTVQKETQDQPAIRLMQIDNGGSTDISSLMWPSRLYLSFHKDGEEFDVNGSYQIARGMSDLKVESVALKNNRIVVSYLVKSEFNMPGMRHFSTLYYEEAIKEIKNATSEGMEPYNLKSTIGVQTYVP